MRTAPIFSLKKFKRKSVQEHSRRSEPNPHLYIRNHPMSVSVKKRMDETNKNFWMGAGIGAVIIIIIDLLIPFMGPLIGGFAAGYIAKGDLLNAGKAGLLAGILAAIVVSVVVFAGIVSHPVAGYVPAVGTGFFLYIVITLYLAILAFLGSAIAGAVRK
jgi:hypothetical protein